MPPSTRSTDPPSIHPPAAFSCSHPEAHCGGSSVVKSARPPTTVGRAVARSVGTLAHTRFLLRAARGKEEEEGRCAAHARKPCAARTLFHPSLPSSLSPSPQVALGPSPATQYRKAQALLRSPRHLLGRPDAEASSSSPPPALPPSGSANMAQTDELVLAFAFASASKWGSEIDAEEEGGSLRGCLAGCLTPRLFMYTRGGTSE